MVSCRVTVYQFEIKTSDSIGKTPIMPETINRTGKRNVKAKRGYKRSSPGMSKVGRKFQAYLKKQALTFGRLADRMDRDPTPRLAGSEML